MARWTSSWDTVWGPDNYICTITNIRRKNRKYKFMMVEKLNKRVAKAFVATALVFATSSLAFLVWHVARCANPRQFQKWEPKFKIEHEYQILKKAKSQTLDIEILQFTSSKCWTCSKEWKLLQRCLTLYLISWYTFVCIYFIRIVYIVHTYSISLIYFIPLKYCIQLEISLLMSMIWKNEFVCCVCVCLSKV